MLRLSWSTFREKWQLFLGSILTVGIGVALVQSSLLILVTAATFEAPSGLSTLERAQLMDSFVLAVPVVGITLALALFLTIFIVSSTFAFTVAQRRRDLALLRLAGAHRTQVRRLLLGEATLLGLVGTAMILVLFIVVVVAMARILTRTRSTFVRITTACITTWIVGQAFVNLGMVTGLLPVIGIPLPFISYGGSALLTTMAAVGVVMSFARVPRTVRVRTDHTPGGPDRDRILDVQEARERGDEAQHQGPRSSWTRRLSTRIGKARR